MSDRTVTEGETPDTVRDPAPPGARPATLGRYRIEDELGTGGMGVVYAAFDPELERRVALKLLAHDQAPVRARERLLREARAMARLTHPNVVHVYEVGTVDNRDYIAMELVDGETLARWLRAEPRPRREIVAAFLMAGAGLVGAHLAGVVHRDFKPHNVLRWRDGRIQVVDFGLARSAGEVEPVVPAGRNTPNPLVHLTQPGAFVGTPAYMAPEQWRDEPVGPEADQFAFCVALWEALAGAHPYGATTDAIREGVCDGPDELDDRAVPARLRPVLRRGLAVDPKARFPSMAALLLAVARAERSRIVPLAAAATAALAIAVIAVLATRGTAAPGCPDPTTDPDSVWSPEIDARLVAAGQGPTARALAMDVASWKEIRGRACEAEPDVRAAELTCLDAVMAIAAVTERTSAEAATPGIAPSDLLEPELCEATPRPRILAPSPLLVEIDEAAVRQDTRTGAMPESAWRAFLPRAKADPCALAPLDTLLANRATSLAEARALYDEALAAADRCGDDQTIATVATEDAKFELSVATTDGHAAAAIARAEADVARMPSREMRAQIEVIHALDDQARGRVDTAITHAEAASDGFAARHHTAYAVELGTHALALRRWRAGPGDAAAIRERYAAYRAIGVADLGEDSRWVRLLDHEAATSAFINGDVETSHAAYERAFKPAPHDEKLAVRTISGTVVDEAGAPVAGARVSVDTSLTSDRIGVIPRDDAHRRTTTDAAGRFSIADAPADGNVVAELGDRVSAAAMVSADPMRLALAPTARVTGHVELHGAPPQTVYVDAVAYGALGPHVVRFVAPIDASGAFVLARVPRTKLRVTATGQPRDNLSQQSTAVAVIDVGDREVNDVMLDLVSSTRVLDVVVRSTVAAPVQRAFVAVYAGHVTRANLREMEEGHESSQSATAERLTDDAPAAVRAAAHPGDLHAHFASVPEGEGTACAVNYWVDAADPELAAKINAHPERLEVRCVPIHATDKVVVVEVPPFPRFD